MSLIWLIVAVVVYIRLGIYIMCYKISRGKLCTELRDWIIIWPVVLLMELVDNIYDKAIKEGKKNV